MCATGLGETGKGDFIPLFCFLSLPLLLFGGEEEMVAAAQKRFLLFHFHPLQEKKTPGGIPSGPIRTHLLFPPQRFSVPISKNVYLSVSWCCADVFGVYLLKI